MKRSLALLALLSLFVLPLSALAQVDTCVGTITLTYVNPPGRPLVVGDVLHVQGNFGSGAIDGGSFILFNKVQFDLDCDTSIPLVPPCTDLGPIIAYAGDATITTTCPGIAWSSNNPGGGFLPNQIEFNAAPVLQVGPNVVNPPGLCHLNFDVTVEAVPASLAVGEIIGYRLAFCDNGLTSGNFQTAATTFASPANREFQCHQTPRHSASRPRQVVSISDPLGSDPAVTVLRSRDLCAPIDKNGENPAAPADPVHLAKYALDGVDQGAFAHPKGVRATTQFGAFVVDVGNVNALLVPTAKSVMPAPPPLALPADAENHFLCHNVTFKSGPAFKTIPLTLSDQFTGPYPMKLDRLLTLCLPASKNAEPVVDPARALLCFGTRANLPLIRVSATIVNQLFNFAPDTVPLTEYTDFCLHATLTP